MNNILKRSSKIILLSTLIIIFCSKIYAQFTVSGYVTDNENNPLDYFHAVIYNSADSSLIVGGAFENGFFELATDKFQKSYLEVSFVGYTKFSFPLDFSQNSNVNIDTIMLEPYSLSEVVISARKPIYKHKEGKVILIVQNTTLSDAGTSIDVIKRAPGVIVDNSDKISIFGKGSPTIFIDGKEVTSKQELEILQSSNIEKITIDRNPSSEYGASTTSVIRIKTKLIKGDALNIEVYDKIQFARLTSNKYGININNKIKKFTNFCSYNFDNGSSKNYFEEYEKNTQLNYSIKNESFVNDKRNDKDHNLFIGSKLDIDSLKSVGIQYRYYINENEMLRNSVQNIYNNDVVSINRLIENNITGTTEHHDISTYYQSIFKNSSSLKLLINFVDIKVDDKSQITEENKTSQSIYGTNIANVKDYQIYSLNTDYSFTVLKNINTKIGVKLANIVSNGTSTLKNDLGIISYVEQNSIDDLIGAGYITCNKNIEKMTINGGIRYELTKSNVLLNSQNIIDSSYFHFFPSFMLDYAFSDNFNINLNYSKKILRPSFSEINPTLFYIDSLSYRIGNPELKPTFIDNITLSVGLSKNFNLSLEYNYIVNDRIFVVLNDEINPDILKNTTINIPKSERIVAFFDYNYSGKKYSIYSSAGFDYSIIDIPYLNDIKKIRSPMYFLGVNNDYTINSNFVIYCNFNYLSRGAYQNIIFNESYNLYAGVSFNLFQKRIKALIEINDILRTSNMAWHTQYGNIESGQVPDYDFRYLKFTLKYNFNNFKSVFKKYSGSQEELRRL